MILQEIEEFFLWKNMNKEFFGTVFGKEKDEFLMGQALEQAHKAYECNEVPIGAIIADRDGTIVARAYNMVEQEHSQRAHAESLAIEQVNKAIGDWRLNDHWIFVTLEPCSMCMALIKLSRFAGVVYGAASPLFGFSLDNNEDLSVYKRDAFSIIDGIKAEESAVILKKFFHYKRTRDE